MGETAERVGTRTYAVEDLRRHTGSRSSSSATKECNKAFTKWKLKTDLMVLNANGERLALDLGNIRSVGDLRDRIAVSSRVSSDSVKLVNAAGDILDDQELAMNSITVILTPLVPLQGKMGMSFSTKYGKHPDPDLGELVAIMLGPNGDYFLDAIIIPRDEQSWEDFIKDETYSGQIWASHGELKMQRLRRPADVLWSFLNYAGFMGWRHA